MRLINRFPLLFLAFFSTFALAAPFNIKSVTYVPGTGGDPADSYNFYIDDCAASGAIGAPFASVTVSGPVSGAPWDNAITADGNYDFCLRAVNAAGENPDPGFVFNATLDDIQLPPAIQDIFIEFECPAGSCSITFNVVPSS